MRRVASLLSTAALVVGLSGVAFTPTVSAAPPGGNDTTAQPASVPDELLVGYAAGTSARERAAARSRAGSRLVSVVVAESPGRAAVELVATPAGGRGQAERRFEADPKVSYAEPNWIYEHAATSLSNDPYYTNGSLWGMYGDATSPGNEYGSQAGEAWAEGNTGTNTVYVGVIDEGIDIRHPDLDGNKWTNQFDVADGLDNDGNGYVDDVNGWDFNGNDNTVYDGKGDDHGTHVAGTIGAEGNNATGVAGVTWDVTLISGKFLGPRGGTTANAIKAVNYFTDLKTRHGLNIVATNNSWGGGGYSQGLYDAIELANAADILFIAAAGNDGADNDATTRYPSGYPNANIIAVASITSSGALSSFSNYGATSVDLGAPGSGVYSTLPEDGYGSYSGTSMATPHVAGAAALRKAAYPTENAAQIKAAILDAATATPTASLSGKTLTGGRLNVSGFVNSDTAAPSAPTGLVATDTTVGGELSLNWEDNLLADGVVGYDVHRSPDGTNFQVVAAGVATSSYMDTRLENLKEYTYRITARDAAGNTSLPSTAAAETPTNLIAPGTPSNLEPTVTDAVALDWSDNPESDVTSYTVHRATGTADPTLLGSSPTSNFTDLNVTPNTTYTYYVRAVDTGGLSSAEPATTSAATPEASVIKLTVTSSKAGPNNKAILTWSGTSVAYVDVKRGGATLTTIATTANDGYYEDNLKRSTGTFTYQVCENDTGKTACSEEVSITIS